MKNASSGASLRAAILTCATVCATLPAYADKTWTGTTDTNWATISNWQESALPDGVENIVFNSASVSNLIINTGANRTVQGISVTNPAGPVTLQNNTLTIGTNGINMASATQDLNLASPASIIRSGVFYWNVPTGRTLTLAAVPHRNSPSGGFGGGNNDNVGGVVRVSTTGTVKLTTPSLAVVADGAATGGNGGNNPFMTYGLDDWAATDASGNVVAATYTADAFTGNANIVTANTYAINGATPSSVRFANTEGAVVVNNTGTSTLRGLLMATSSQTVSISGGFIRPNRNNTGGATFSIIQNSTTSDLTISSSISNASSNTAVSLSKSGPGKLILNAGHGFTGRTFVHEGTLQLGDGVLTGSLTSTARVINNSSLVIINTDASALTGVIAGTGTFAKSGTGVLTLGAANVYTGTTTITGGLVNIGAAASFGTTPSISLDGGGIQWSAAADISTLPVTIGAAGTTFDTMANAVVLASPIGNSGTGPVTKTGTGSLSLGAANLYSGATTVSAGTLLATNTTGSATGSGTVTVQTGAAIGGTGSISGVVTVESGGKLTPGASVGTLTVGGLDLDSGSTLDLEFGATNDKVTVSNPGGLTIDGGAITLLLEGSANAFATPGTYQLFGYSGSIGGAGVSSLSVANPQPGFTYTFGTAGGFVTLTVGTSGVVRNWITNGSGSWTNNANWNGTFPNSSGATANFQLNLTAPATITLDGAKTVGSLTFLSAANGYTITPGSGGSLTLNNGGSNSSLLDGAGQQTLAVPLILGSNTVVDTSAAVDSITISGAVAGSATLTKTGPGSLSLLASNTMSGAITLSGGSTAFVSGGLGSGNLSLSNSTLQWAAGNTQDISNRTITLNSGVVTLDTGAGDVLFASAIGNNGSADLVKAGDGKLTLSGDNTHGGMTTISKGTLQLGNGGTSGSVLGDIVNNGELRISRSADTLFTNLISGTGSMVFQGPGNLQLGSSNTFSGPTSITGGTITLFSGLGLQNSTLNYVNGGGTLDLDINTAVTLGGLEGNKSLSLTNFNLQGVALTIGGNGQGTTYSGDLGGEGSLIKTGAGVTVLTGTHTYVGTTAVNGGAGTGALELDSGASITGGGLTVTGNSRFTIFDGSYTTTVASNVTNAGTTTATFELLGGSATFSGGLSSGGNANIPYLISIAGGTLNASSLALGRTSQSITAEPLAGINTAGLYINGGAVNVSGNVTLGTSSGSNSSVNVKLDSGSLTIGGALTIGLNNGGRWSVVDVNGGTLTNTDTVTGIQLGGTLVGNAALVINAGVATAERIVFGQGTNTGTHVVRVVNGELYVGAGGMVDGSTADASFIRLTGGTLGAKAAWSTVLPVELTNIPIIKAADVLNTAQDITLNGAVTGAGGLQKTGDGILTLAGTYAYTGATIVADGTLTLPTTGLSDAASIEVKSGAVLNLTHSATDNVKGFYIDGIAQATGTWGRIGSPTAAHTTALITGDGILNVLPDDPFAGWMAGFPSLAGVNVEKGADPDGDGFTNLEEFAFDGVPDNPVANGKIRSRIETVGSEQALVLTLPVRDGAVFDNVPGPGLDATVDRITYAIQGSNNLTAFDQAVTEIPANSTGLPPASTGWTYRCFRLSGAIPARGTKGFLAATATESP
ncbi:beta strand repeat-containing protein [Luteolibacter luteus]|uniref:Uncharacterized protein n=1 Tax=Luteolibacter luteus TaxID=2728835 RepID=A0A858RNW7_9BACT|nr:autotransporter-associated beta strand repeat-containing protein [Luteolibacter luteus]QJE98552.1 hypothetical protein HHL09_23140 [Luteolibacter luteus]